MRPSSMAWALGRLVPHRCSVHLPWSGRKKQKGNTNKQHDYKGGRGQKKRRHVQQKAEDAQRGGPPAATRRRGVQSTRGKNHALRHYQRSFVCVPRPTFPTVVSARSPSPSRLPRDRPALSIWLARFRTSACLFVARGRGGRVAIGRGGE